MIWKRKQRRELLGLVIVVLTLILKLNCTGQGTAPGVLTLGAFGTNGDIVFNGLVNPNGTSATAWFEWGATTSSNATPVTDIGSGTSNVLFSETVTGLTPGVAYNYRIVATNSVGLSKGEEALTQSPRIVLKGENPLTTECHQAFFDLGASAVALPAAMAGGYGYSMALKYDGTVAAWGGSGNSETYVPANLSNVVAIAAGQYHALALKADGTVVGWGDGYSGATSPPSDLTNAVAIAAGLSYSLALRENGVVIGWGKNFQGQTNVPPGLSDVVAIAAGGEHALALKSDGTVVAWGANASGRNVPTGLSNVIAIAAGWNRSLALKNDGTVVGWGEADVPLGLSNVTSIVSGLFYSMALRSDGTVIGWGFDSGQIAAFALLTNVVTIAAGGYHAFATTSDGSLLIAGYNLYGQCIVPDNLGGDILTTGSVDYNHPGVYSLSYTARNLMNGTGTATRSVVVADRIVPTLTLAGGNPLILPINVTFGDPGAKANDACAGNLTDNIVVTGSVNTGAIGTNILTYSVTDSSGNTSFTNRIIVIIPGLPFVTTLEAQITNDNAILSGVVNANGAPTTAWFEWGTNILHGIATSPAEIGGGLTNNSIQIPLSGLTIGQDYHFRLVAINDAGRSNGRDIVFRIGSKIETDSPVMLSGITPMTIECHSEFVDPGAATVAPLAGISAGTYYSLGLKTDGKVVSWGNATPVPPGLSNVISVAAGYTHSLALKTDGTVAGWGDDSYGEITIPIGLSNVVAVSSGWGFSLALKADGTVAAWGLGATNPPNYDGLHYGEATVPIGFTNLVAIAAGFDSSLAVRSDGKVVSWGRPQPWRGIYQDFSGIVIPDDLSNVVAVATGMDFGLALKSDGTVVGVGYGGEGQTTVPSGLSNVVAIATGIYHSLALKSDGTVVGWGDDFYGEATPPPGLDNVLAIAAGADHSLALKSDGTVVGWGLGFYGETDITTSGPDLVERVTPSGVVNTNDPGHYTLIYRATNSFGKVSSATRKVIVVDTIPPDLEPPTNIIVEFASETGATVLFNPKAADLCSPSIAVKCSPKSGDRFRIGTTSVKCAAADASGNIATSNFYVTVLGAQGVKSNVLSELSLLPTNTLTQSASKDLSGAVSNLKVSLTPGSWRDETHIGPTHGGSVFNSDRATIQNLLKLAVDGHGTISKAMLKRDIERLVKTDSLLALVAIQEASKKATNLKTVNTAKLAVAQGNIQLMRGNYETAVKYFQTAWTLATRLIYPQAK